MTKHYCDMCKKELNAETRYHGRFKIAGFSGMADTVEVEYCEECVGKVIGEEHFAHLMELKEERRKRRIGKYAETRESNV